MCSMCNNSNNHDPYIRSTVYILYIHGSDSVVMSAIDAVHFTKKKIHGKYK